MTQGEIGAWMNANILANSGTFHQIVRGFDVNMADLYGLPGKVEKGMARDSFNAYDAENSRRQLGGSNAYFCDRCNKPFVISRGTTPLTITFAAPGSGADQYSESITLGVCSECYLLVRRACGLEEDKDVTEAFRKRERDLSTPKALPRIIFDPEGDEFDKRLAQKNDTVSKVSERDDSNRQSTEEPESDG